MQRPSTNCFTQSEQRWKHWFRKAPSYSVYLPSSGIFSQFKSPSVTEQYIHDICRYPVVLAGCDSAIRCRCLWGTHSQMVIRSACKCRSIVFASLILFFFLFFFFFLVPTTGQLTRYLTTGCSESDQTWQSDRSPWGLATEYFWWWSALINLIN